MHLITYAQCFWSFINLYLVRLCHSLQNSFGFLIQLFIYIAPHTDFCLHPPTLRSLSFSLLSHHPVEVLILISHLQHICMNTQTCALSCRLSHYLLLADVKRCFAHLQEEIISFPCRTLVLLIFLSRIFSHLVW